MNKKGFTLIEIMIAMLVGGLVTGAIYSSFISQQQNALIQDQIVEIQQNMRAAVDIMTREIRMAGFDDTEKTHLELTPASVLVAGPAQIVISMDLNFNGMVVDPDPAPPDLEAGEVIAYRFCDDAAGVRLDNINNGIADAGVANFGRNTGGNIDADPLAFAEGMPDIPGGLDYSPIAENIQAVGFAYAFIDPATNALAFNDTSILGGGNGIQDFGETFVWAVDTNADEIWNNLDTNTDGIINETDLDNVLPAPAFGTTVSSAINGTNMAFAQKRSAIRAVRIWILARARNPDPKYTNNSTYVVGRQVIKVNDNFRRRLLEVIVDLRSIKTIAII